MYFCGYATGMVADETRLNWAGDEQRPISWSAWYPTGDEPSDEDRAKGLKRIFVLGDVVEGASLSGDNARWPVVLLSHGTGGTADELGWLAVALVQQGYVVLAPNHHGNTALEPFREEAFACWWERAIDLSRLLDILAEQGPFAGRLDPERVFAAGFSMGGYTSLVLAGARTSVEQFTVWSAKTGLLGSTAKIFPKILEHIPQFLETSEVFQAAYARQAADLSDPRVKAVFAMAPAPPIRGFLVESVVGITRPVHIVTGDNDVVAPRAECADWLKANNPAFYLSSVGSDVGHTTFLGLPTRIGRRMTPDVFVDNEGVDRAQVHADIIAQALAAFGDARERAS